MPQPVHGNPAYDDRFSAMTRKCREFLDDLTVLNGKTPKGHSVIDNLNGKLLDNLNTLLPAIQNELNRAVPSVKQHCYIKKQQSEGGKIGAARAMANRNNQLL